MTQPIVVNLQRKVKLQSDDFRSFIKACDSIGEAAGKTFSIAFISDRRMKELNKFFRGKDISTDVLSFPHEPDEFEVLSSGFSRPDSTTASTETEATLPNQGGEPENYLGDIVISAELAQRQAKENGLTLENEIKQLLHGILHLCGYDHETDNGEMNARELKLRDKLGI